MLGRRGLTTVPVAVLAVLVLALILAPSGVASPNTGPSTAQTVSLGVPFSGSWPGTKGARHWWRLSTTLRPGDEVQLAVDSRDEITYFCMVPPVDDFDASNALLGCDSRDFYVQGQNRVIVPYDLATGQPFLVAANSEYWGPSAIVEHIGGGGYSVTIERIVTLVNIGMAIPSQIPSDFSLIANLTYGDNAPAADGIPAFLQWRYLPTDSATPEPFVNVATAVSSGGVATFVGAMPAAAQGGTVQLRACVTQPGGDAVRCGPSGEAAVAVSACSRALVSRRARTRAVRRTKHKLRQARARNAGRAKRSLARELKLKRRKLAKAKRSVTLHCA